MTIRDKMRPYYQNVEGGLFGEVGKADVGEFGFATLNLNPSVTSPLFKGIEPSQQVWMSHQDGVLELGEGFCFEARQKRIIIDDKYYFIDLVFYNRLLHCSVIIELKNDEFKHENLLK